MLSDTKIRNTKPRAKRFKLYDERALYLEIAPAGGQWWRLKYRFAGKERGMSLGVYPEVGLKEARERRDDARRLLRDGIDPMAARKALMAASAGVDTHSFEVVALEWHAKFSPGWADSHAVRVAREN